MGQERGKGLYDLPKGAERRKHKRYRIAERGIIHDQGISSPCVVQNFSEGGALLELDVLLSKGAEVEVQSATLGRLAATVVRVRTNRLMVRFKEAISIDPPRQAADMREANLFRAELAGADLSGADLFRADLTEAFLRKAHLSGANLFGAILPRADLFRADLRKADLREANLLRADLSGADLSGADLSGANLTEAFLGKADLSGANLGGADLTGADITARQLVLANNPLEATLDDDLRTGLKALLAEAEGKADESAGGE